MACCSATVSDLITSHPGEKEIPCFQLQKGCLGEAGALLIIITGGCYARLRL